MHFAIDTYLRKVRKPTFVNKRNHGKEAKPVIGLRRSLPEADMIKSAAEERDRAADRGRAINGVAVFASLLIAQLLLTTPSVSL